MLVGGRVGTEDAYAYGKFARTVLGTNDVDFRARPHSAEEADFLASTVVATGPDGGAVTYADLETAGTVLLVGLEPEDESPIVFLRLRKAFRKHRTAVYAVAPVATRGLAKVGGTLIPTAPGTEPEVLGALAEGSGTDVVAAAGQGLRDNAVVLVGERLATVPGALSAAAALAEATGARLAWVPRRAGERGALEAGALPTLLPGGRPLADAAARAEVASAWGVESLADTAGRDTAGIVAAAASGEHRRARRRRCRPRSTSASPAPSTPSPARSSCRSRSAPRRSPRSPTSCCRSRRTPRRPAPSSTGRAGSAPSRRPSPPRRSATTGRSTCSPTRWASSSGTRTVREVRAEMAALGPWQGARAAAPAVEAGDVPERRGGHPGARHLAPPARPRARCRTASRSSRAPPRPRSPGCRPTTASGLGVVDGDALTVRVGDTTVTAPVLVSEMADHVVWLPTNSVGSDLRAALAGAPGALVSVTKEDPA